MPRMADVTGQRFNRVVAIRRTDVMKGPHKLWLCQCDCGTEFLAFVGNLRGGRQQSCGCLGQETRTKHGYSTRKVRHYLYGVWLGMNDRCSNPNRKEYPRYGGRGIRVCEAWRGGGNFPNFFAWAEANGWQKGLDLDRIDNDKGYSPENCRFVSKFENRSRAARGRKCA